MTDRTTYDIRKDIRFGPLEVIDVPAMVEACEKPWFNQTLCGVNDCVVRLGIIQGEFHWHKHDLEDELFYVVEGQLMIDLRERTVTLGPNQGFVVPRTIEHRTRAPERVVMLMIEGRGVKPTGD